VAGLDSRLRSLTKALTWRLTALAITVTVAWLVTRRADVAAGIGAADALVKLVAYYGHERAWLRSDFGRSRTVGEGI